MQIKIKQNIAVKGIENSAVEGYTHQEREVDSRIENSSEQGNANHCSLGNLRQEKFKLKLI